jgi:histidine triad (HIT) family protein
MKENRVRTNRQPSLIVISGPAASGKTTLGKYLARELSLPYFFKDQFKEPLYDILGHPEQLEMHRKMGAISHLSLDLITEQLIKNSVDHIVEGPFQDAFYTPFLKSLKDRHPFKMIQIQLKCDGKVLTQRFIEREKTGSTHPGHQGIKYLDAMIQTLQRGELPLLSIESETLVVDTTDLERLKPELALEFVRGALKSSGPQSKETSSSCIFCQIISNRLEANFVYRDTVSSAFLDIHPINPGHILIVPNDHCERFYDLRSDTAEHIFGIARNIYAAMKKAPIRCEGANIFLSDGQIAGQEVPHSHLHIAPRFENDGHKPGFSHSDPDVANREELDRIAKQLSDSLRSIR